MKTVSVYYVAFGKKGVTTAHLPVEPILGEMQRLVGGDVERYDMRHVMMPAFSLWMNEMPDRTASIPHETPFCTMQIYGDFFITRERELNIIGVTVKDYKMLDMMLRLYMKGARLWA